jgi:hypothetical protein
LAITRFCTKTSFIIYIFGHRSAQKFIYLILSHSVLVFAQPDCRLNPYLWFAGAFTITQLQSELKISEANAGAKPANLSESEFPEFYNSQNKDKSPFISHPFHLVPTAIL